MIDTWKPLEKCLRLHHVNNGGKVGDLHNEQHADINVRLAGLESRQLAEAELQKISRSLADDASQLGTTAWMTGGDKQLHLRGVIDKVNKFLPEEQKLMIARD